MKLRDFRIDDSAIVAKLCNDNELAKWTASIPHPYVEQNAIDWITGIDTSGRAPYAVIRDNDLIGCVSMWDVEAAVVEIGYWIGRDYWGLGYGKSAVKLLLEKINKMHYEKVVAQVVDGNTASQSLLKSFGFTQSTKLELARFGVQYPGHLYELQLTGSTGVP